MPAWMLIAAVASGIVLVFIVSGWRQRRTERDWRRLRGIKEE